MMSLVAGKKPLFPPSSSKIPHGVIFSPTSQECLRPDIVSPNPISDKAQLQFGPILPPNCPVSPKLPLMPPKVLVRETKSWNLPETGTVIGISKQVGAVYSSLPNILPASDGNQLSIIVNCVSTTLITKPTVMNIECEFSVMAEHKQQTPSGKLPCSGPISPPISPQKYVVMKSITPTKGPSPPPISFRPLEEHQQKIVFGPNSPKRGLVSTELHEVNAVRPFKAPETSPSKPSSAYTKVKKPPIPPPKSPAKKTSRHNSLSSVLSENGQETTPPPRNSSATVQLVPSSSTKLEVTTKTLTFPANIQAYSEARSSIRLIRIEPTLPSNTYNNQATQLSLIEDCSFPCSISPGTLRSMELLFR